MFFCPELAEVTPRVTARNYVIPELIKYYQLFSQDMSRLGFQTQMISV